jgi:hypothetical protein
LVLCFIHGEVFLSLQYVIISADTQNGNSGASS